MHFVDLLDIHASTKHVWAPPLLFSDTFKHNNVIEICDGITFDFYMGLPHMHVQDYTSF